MFATDYPHWDFDAPDQALPKIELPDGFAAKLMAENARAAVQAAREVGSANLTEVGRRHGRRDPARGAEDRRRRRAGRSASSTSTASSSRC